MGGDLFIDKAAELVAHHIKRFVFKAGFTELAGIQAVLNFMGNGAPRGIRVAMCRQHFNRWVGRECVNDVGRNAKGRKADKLALRHGNAALYMG